MDEISPERVTSDAPVHPREFERLASVCGLCVQELGRDPFLDQIAHRSAAIFGASIGLVTLVDEHEQTFAGRSGIDQDGTTREESFCAHTILQDVPLLVEDAREDRRFSHLPLVTRRPCVRFYAGAPIFDRSGLPLGSVCVLDGTPRRNVSAARVSALVRMATMVSALLESRRLVRDLLGPYAAPAALERGLTQVEEIFSPICEMVSGYRSAENEF